MKNSLGLIGSVMLGLVGGLLVLGCGGNSLDHGIAPEQLEAVSVKSMPDAGNGLTTKGVATVTGAAREFKVDVQGMNGTVAVTLHSSGQSPLDKLNMVDVDMEVTPAELAGSSLFVSDSQGPLYIASSGSGTTLEKANQLLGAGTIAYGAEVAVKTEGVFVYSYTKPTFATDDGPVTVLPGDVTSLHIGGATWRVVVVAAYRVSTDPEATELPGCGPEDILSFEMLRVMDAPAKETLARTPGMNVAALGCTGPGQ